MDPKEMLGVLLHTTDEQQKAIAELLSRLKDEIVQLKKAAKEAQQGATKVEESARAVDSAISGALPALQQAAGDGARVAVVGSMEGAAQAAATALDKASQPVLDQLKGVVEAASQAKGQLRRAAAWFSWQWMVLAAGTTGAAMLVLWTMASVYVRWQRNDIEALAAQRQELRAEVLQLQATADEWVKKGGRAKLERCGDKERLCVRVDKAVGFGKEADFFVLRGY